MRVNSWLYHYYTVQSKLQYGLAYDPAAQVSRMGNNNNNNNTQYYQHPQSMSPYQENQVYHHHPHHHPQVSPSPHHHQPIPQALGHPEAFRYTSGRRSEPEPVDYSVHSEPDIKVESSPRSSPASVDLDRGGGGGGGGGGGTLLMSATQSLGRSRLLVKAATTLDPAELMDQWNPSPPWSDTALQKVPDILHQDLSPYVTTTPPTPGSAVSYQHPPPPAFTFDWPPHEQYVPNVNMNVNTPLALMDEEHSQLLSMGGCWSHHQTPASAGVVSDHRLFPLQPPPPPRPALLLRLEQESAADQHILLPAVTKGKNAEYVSFVNLSGARTIMAMVSGKEIILGQTTTHRFPLPKKSL
ncbi:PAS [Nesidiocoris tenuis]|uniref:PAS n=1 Tax=Nesidiocoris tenuis TaxID=355587 RepID=A0ABN7BCW0_9HEMI|nr:PAS [Nesidiocoris tenuis]